MIRYASILAASLSISLAQPALSERYDRSIIVVIDNGATVQDQRGSGAQDRPMYDRARLALINHLAETHKRGGYLSVISTYRPQVIWSGSARKSNRARNDILLEFLKEEISGCVDFTKVATVLRREIRNLPIPPSEIYILSSLIQTSGVDAAAFQCMIDKEALGPPKAFYEALADISPDASPQIYLHWVYDEVMNGAYEHADQAGLAVKIYGENQTINWLQQ